MESDTQQLCAHPACACIVEAGHEYCSEYCNNAADQSGTMEEEMENACGCGHPQCDQPADM
ncbi:MAG: hypothetical protein V4443_09295 [Pseudomonadota bacterium]